MFKLVGVQGVLFAVEDTADGVIDILPKGKLCECLNLGLEIGGVSRIGSDEFSYTEEYFYQQETEECEGNYDDEDYPYEDDGYSSEDYEIDEDEDYSDEDYEVDEEDNDSVGDDYNSSNDGYDSEDFDDGYGDDYEEEEISTVNRLYSFLNEEQIKLLKRYYLWFSQRIFDEGRQQARTLQVTSNPRKLQKQKQLNVMRNQGGLWAYAGFIDMGYRGADYCTLGHPLRYVHLAWDISVSDIETSFFGEDYSLDIEMVINSNNCIKFGIDCISDFFEIDKEYTDKLKKAQREAIKDMDFMCKYYEDGIADSVIDSFTVTDNLVNKIAFIDSRNILLRGSKYECIVPKSLTSFYKQFRTLGMVVPKSLVQEIRDNLIGWDSHKFIGWRVPAWGTVRSKMVALIGKNSEHFFDGVVSNYITSYYSVVRDYLTDFLQLKSCGYYEYNADTFKEEGGASKPLKYQLASLRGNISKNFWSDVEYSLDYLNKLIELDNLLQKTSSLLDGYRTPSISFSNTSNRWYLDSDVMDTDFQSLRNFDDKYATDIYMSLDFIRELDRPRASICKISYRETYALNDYLDKLRLRVLHLEEEQSNYRSFTLENLNNEISIRNAEIESKELEEKRRQEEEERLQAEKKRNEEEERNKLETMSDEDIRQYVFVNHKKVKGNKKLKFALTVMDTVQKTGRCSDKQMYYINQIYAELTGVQKEDTRQSDKVSLDDRKDIEGAIDKVLDNPSLIEDVDDSDKVYKILTSIKRYRSISERQMKYAEIALDVVKRDM